MLTSDIKLSILDVRRDPGYAPGFKPVFTCSKSTIETPEQCEKSAQSFTQCSGVTIADFEQVNADWDVMAQRHSGKLAILKF